MTIETLIQKHATAVAEIEAGLLNCDIPAQRTINAGFARMGVNRFTAHGDDLWEMIVCHKNGWTYERPPAHLVVRWASY